MRHPGVRDVTTQVYYNNDDRNLVSYVVPRNGEIPLKELRRFCLQFLPAYMVPTLFLTLGSVPLTQNGKVDRNALPPPTEGSRRAAQSHRPAETATEQALVRIWTEVLSLNEIGIDENFFDLGGHSLLATRVASQIRKQFNVDLPLRHIFESPTIATLASRIDEVPASVIANAQEPDLMPVARDAHRRRRSQLTL